MAHAGGEASGYFEVFLKYGQPPGWHYGQWDFRQAYQYYQTEQDKDQEVKFDAQTEGFQTGTPVNAYDFDARGTQWPTAHTLTVQCTLLPLHVVAAGGFPALMRAFGDGLGMCHT